MAKKRKTKKKTVTASKKKRRTRKVGRAKAKRVPGQPRGITEERLEEYVRVHAESLLDDPNITSVGVGYKSVGGKVTPTLAIQFTVGTKIEPQELSGRKPIPETLRVGDVDVPTDVIERSFKPSYIRVTPEAKDSRRARAATLQPGMSVGGAFTGAGTIGAFVSDRTMGRRVLLSNWHVLQGPKGSVGTDVVQPGQFDDNRVQENRIGEVVRSHLGAAGDCAIASVGGREISNKPIEINSVEITAIGKPVLGDHVVKSGRTTGLTYGVVTRIGVNAPMTYGTAPDIVSAIVGGFEIGPDPDRKAPDNEISRAGDSGSAWLAIDANGKPTEVMLGLHFAGDADNTVSEVALACYANSVMTKLEVEPLAIQKPQALGDDDDGLRTGFARDFLDFPIGEVSFTPTRSKDLAVLDGDREIRYCHFSVWLSKGRKYPLCVAWNIDGSRYVSLNRKSFRTDQRGTLEKYQLTNDIYASNPFDKGHIARRADLCWGSKTEAELGNYDSFYYTNIVPQHEAFNQSGKTYVDDEGGAWGRLENAIFDSENPHDLHVSLFGGPVFGNSDPRFEQEGESCRIPKAFWKIVAYVDDEDGKEKAFGFLLSQADAIKGLVPEGIDLSKWVWARITLSDLEQKTGVRFPSELHDREVPFVGAQAIVDGVSLKPLLSPSEYFAG